VTAGAAGDDAGLAVLMAVRVKGRADAAAVAGASGTAPEECAAVLEAAAARGALALAPDGRRYLLTATGREELAGLLARTPIDRPALSALYDAFLVADVALKGDVTRWQEDRTPPLLRVVCARAAEAERVAARLAAVVPRYALYERRLAAARARLEAGDERWVAHPGVDSLHQVWFELHEDLLVVLDRVRAA
jgi:pyruvate,orthophosphate dikinase